MTLELPLFVFLAALAIASGLLMILQKNPVISVIFMVINFVCIAGIYLLLQAQFLAVMQIIVYAGGIMVLFLFIIMLLSLAEERAVGWHPIYRKYIPVGMGLVLLAELSYAISESGQTRAPSVHTSTASVMGTVESAGVELFTRFLFPFEVVSLLLLAAIVGAVLLAKKKI